MDEAQLRKLVPFLASTVVIPAGMAALGIPWLVVFSVTLMLTLVVAVGAYSEHQRPILVGVVISGLFCLWTINREVGYTMTYQFCRNQTLVVVDGDPRVAVYELGVRLFNENPYKLYMRVDDQTVRFGDRVAVSPSLGSSPFPVYPRTRKLVLSGTIRYLPAIELTKVPNPHVRFVIKYGRDPEALNKQLIVSGTVILNWLQNGDTALDFSPDADSEEPVTDQFCRFRAQAI